MMMRSLYYFFGFVVAVVAFDFFVDESVVVDNRHNCEYPRRLRVPRRDAFFQTDGLPNPTVSFLYHWGRKWQKDWLDRVIGQYRDGPCNWSHDAMANCHVY